MIIHVYLHVLYTYVRMYMYSSGTCIVNEWCVYTHTRALQCTNESKRRGNNTLYQGWPNAAPAMMWAAPRRLSHGQSN